MHASNIADMRGDRGAMLTTMDASGYTGLHYASLYGHRDTVLLLIQHGADIFEVRRSME